MASSIPCGPDPQQSRYPPPGTNHHALVTQAKKKNPTSLESLAVSSPINRSNQLNQDNSETNEGNGDEHSPGKLMTPNSTQAPPTDEEELQRARVT
ncbi:hypothetical protein KEM48_003274 [Puccinia striiformis f. sp. tritici PST-130]|nr:hypothetical protein KEM48_003274 [Puccinia striiformis f. sp. tritici PST-130]